MKLLIVDDSDIIRQTIQNYLCDKAIDIIGQASNGEEAIEIFKRELPDIVTMDINMPQMDGITCMEQMLEIKKDSIIVIISAVAKKIAAIDALDKGASGYIRKPFSEEDIVNLLNDFVK